MAWACSSSGTQPDSAEDTRAYLVATACSEAAWRRAAARIVSACWPVSVFSLAILCMAATWPVIVAATDARCAVSALMACGSPGTGLASRPSGCHW